MKRYVLIVGLSLLMLALAMPVNAAPPARPPRVDALKGQRINLYPGFETSSFSSGEETYVWHGWATGGTNEAGVYLGWSEMSSTQKVEFLKTALFELYVDGDPVELHRTQWHNQKTDAMYVLWWTTFDAGTFTVGQHEFVGVWSCLVDGNLDTWDNTASIVVA